jgi:hypothetical protein
MKTCFTSWFLVFALVLLGAGCEDLFDPMSKYEHDWVVPSNISGTWFHSQPTEVAQGDGYIISQNGSSASVTHFFRRLDGSTFIAQFHPYQGTYDQSSGLLTYTIISEFYMRFASDTEMWSVDSPSSDRGILGPFNKE